jgi:hypothetical protein
VTVGEALRRTTPSPIGSSTTAVLDVAADSAQWIPRSGVSDPYAGPTTAKTRQTSKGLAAVFTKGNTRYLVVSLTALAGLLASLGGSWFDGS